MNPGFVIVVLLFGGWLLAVIAVHAAWRKGR